MTKDILGCERTRIPTRSEQRRLRKLIKRYRKEWARAAYVRLQKEQGAKPAGDYDTFAKAAYRANQCHAKDSVKP